MERDPVLINSRNNLIHKKDISEGCGIWLNLLIYSVNVSTCISILTNDDIWSLP